MKEEALKLADWLDKSISADDFGEMAKYYQWCHENVSPMIRRLVEELDKQGSSIWDSTRRVYENCQCDSCKNKEPQTKPLSDDEIHDIWKSLWEGGNIGHIAYNYARAIEERHGIK